ncbi:PREDICTED: leucine zipper protein 4-like, partial [Lipotes vexillifer]|uniref:Leucine zipper protein 4-like n=1 Tax=Lipotes vexillifer TaxID=118797 RepID=A0A340YB53_LIPVE
EKCNENSKAQAVMNQGQSERNQHQSEGSQGQSEENQHYSERSQGHSKRSHGQAERSHRQSERSRGQKERSHRQSERSHGQSERSHRQSERSRGQAERSHRQSERSHGQSERSHGQSERSHGQKDLVAKQRDLIINQKDLMAKQRDLIINQKDLVAKQRDLIVNQKDLVAKQRDLISQSERSHDQSGRYKRYSSGKSTISLENEYIIFEKFRRRERLPPSYPPVRFQEARALQKVKVVDGCITPRSYKKLLIRQQGDAVGLDGGLEDEVCGHVPVVAVEKLHSHDPNDLSEVVIEEEQVLGHTPCKWEREASTLLVFPLHVVKFSFLLLNLKASRFSRLQPHNPPR